MCVGLLTMKYKLHVKGYKILADYIDELYAKVLIQYTIKS